MNLFFNKALVKLISKKRLKCHTSPVILYHSILRDLPRSQKSGLDNVFPEILHNQLVWLKDNFDIISIDDYSSLENKKGYASITFDDGYKDLL